MLWGIIMAIVAVFLVYQAAKFNIFLGILVMLAFVAIVIYMRYTALCIMMAQRQHTKGEMDKAFEWFERGYKHGMTVQQRVNYAYYLMRDGRLEKSEEIYNRILGFKLPPNDKYYAKSNYAILLWKKGEIDRAIEELEEIFPYYRTTNVYGTLGYMYILKKDWDKAKEFNDEAYDYNNENTVILDNMTILYHELGQDAEAEKYADELLEKKPTFAEGFYDIANVKYALKKYGEALDALDQALEIKPSFMTTVKPDKLKAFKAEIEAAMPEPERRAREAGADHDSGDGDPEDDAGDAQPEA